MKPMWLATAIALSLGGTLVGCHGGDRAEQGGGGGRQVVPNDRLPESNEVNPSPTSDTYIDDRAERQHEGEQHKR
jgi:hypothetical protein